MALYKRSETVRDFNGVVVSKASVRVVTGTTYSDQAPLASLFQDQAGLIPLSNPVAADAAGQYGYWVEAGFYAEKVSRPGYYSETNNDLYIGAIPGAQGPAGAAGPAGPQGASGAQGPAGPPDTTLRSDLADVTSPALNAGLIGLNLALAYAANTVGEFLKDLTSSIGSTLIGYLAPFTGAVVQTLAQVIGSFPVSPRWFGAVGDGVTDDTSALRYALRSSGPAPVIDTADAGREIYIPPGTYMISSPLFLRKGDVLRGAGGTATIIKTTTGFPIGQAMLYIGFNTAGTQDPGGLAPIVDGVMFESGVASVIGVSTLYGAGPAANPGAGGNCISGWRIKNCWFIVPTGIRGAGTEGEISGCVFDGSSIDMMLIGDGNASSPATHSILIQKNTSYAASYANIQMDGVSDVMVTSNIFEYAKQFGVFFSNTVTGGTTYNVNISNNKFITSLAPAYYTATQTDIDIEWPVNGLQLVNNTHSFSRKASINIAHGSAFNITINGCSFQSTNDTAISISGAGDAPVISGCTFNNIGNYGIDSSLRVIATGNKFGLVFTVAGTPANAYQNGCIRLNGADNSIVRDNYTSSTASAAVVANSGGTGISTSNNRSGWSTADFYCYNAAVIIEAYNQRSVNGGGPASLLVTPVGNGLRMSWDNAIPTVGARVAGDRVINSVPAVGSPKAWACTVAGTPGTWVSEGNL